eukprot:TRINITY_DN64004_c0_g1_i1.p1 TRINITY_DN64004_c0_g1~~TRINITY_DN64004_c0_g1_i1.p1  ORF type:complete len:566 (-),score=129.99 TRINITY_DN64004_c0_g1_i1:42-1568(-)
MCKRRMEDIHLSHGLSLEEREKHLRRRHFQVPGQSGRSLTLLEDPSGRFATGTSGAVLWPAVVSLIEHLDEKVHASCLNSTRVLELGAGLGAAGLFLALHKGCEVVVTETPESLPLLARNISENCAEGSGGPQVAPLRWGSSEHIGMLAPGTYDLVIGSDVTYRPDCLDDLLSTAAQLLEPRGSLVLTLQDRRGEAEQLEQALATCSCRPFRIASRSEKVVSSVASPAGEEGVKVLLFELRLSEDLSEEGCMSKISNGYAPTSVPSTAAEVEEEFFRITGIRPDPVNIPPKPKPKEPPQPQPAGLNFKERIVKELLSRGMGDYLCDVDDELKAKLEAQIPEKRPSTESQRRRFAEEHYASAVSEATREDWFGDQPGQSCEVPELDSEVTAQEKASEPVPTSVKAGATARVCLNGLDWDIEEDQEQLAVNVSFGDDLWLALSGVSGCDAFKEAVSFELADEELRVLHAGTVVLDLKLPVTVDATRAAASVSSRKKRVAVRAPKSKAEAI